MSKYYTLSSFWKTPVTSFKFIGYNQQYFDYKPTDCRPQEPRRPGAIGYNG
jgi:hypothetical protein